MGSSTSTGSFSTPLGSGWLKAVISARSFSPAHLRKTVRIVALSSLHLSSEDKATIRTVFLRWAGENERAEITAFNHPEPSGVLNDPVLVDDPIAVRWAANNYYTAHMRSIGLMAMALDPEDDPGGELRSHLDSATGAWLYVIDHLLRNDGS